MYGGKFAFQNRLGWPYSWKEFTVFLCFTLYLWTISEYKPPGGLYLEGRFNGGVFALRVWGGLYLEVLIHGGAYFRNFTVSYAQPSHKDCLSGVCKHRY